MIDTRRHVTPLRALHIAAVVHNCENKRMVSSLGGILHCVLSAITKRGDTILTKARYVNPVSSGTTLKLNGRPSRTPIRTTPHGCQPMHPCIPLTFLGKNQKLPHTCAHGQTHTQTHTHNLPSCVTRSKKTNSTQQIKSNQKTKINHQLKKKYNNKKIQLFMEDEGKTAAVSTAAVA